jgi:hypothetical protein
VAHADVRVLAHDHDLVDAEGSQLLIQARAVEGAVRALGRHDLPPSRPGLQHSEGALSIRVEDEGSWHPPAASVERGRGIPLMRAVMDTAEVEHDGRGTRVNLGLLLV